MLPEIYELFVQGERTRDRSRGGLGIGLTLVRRLVELHGGSIEAFSEGTGRGSRFTVRLRAAPELHLVKPVDPAKVAALSAGTEDEGSAGTKANPN